jgi:hypothetical protein
MDIPAALRFKTRNLADVVILDMNAPGDHPIAGMIYLNDDWIEMNWTRAGRLDDNIEHQFDIDFDNTEIVQVQ